MKASTHCLIDSRCSRNVARMSVHALVSAKAMCTLLVLCYRPVLGSELVSRCSRTGDLPGMKSSTAVCLYLVPHLSPTPGVCLYFPTWSPQPKATFPLLVNYRWHSLFYTCHRRGLCNRSTQALSGE